MSKPSEPIILLAPNRTHMYLNYKHIFILANHCLQGHGLDLSLSDG